jgi:hypothetical protein
MLMPEVAIKPESQNGSDKSARSLGSVIKHNKKQREFEQAVKDWANGKLSYDEVWAKNPNARKPTAKDILLFIFLGKK